MGKRYQLTNKSDSIVWGKLKEGDREALRILFERYYSDLLNYAVKLSRNRSLAKDCVQELYYRIWDRRSFLGDITSVKAYLWVSLRRDLFKAMNRDERHALADDYFSYNDMLTFTHEDFLIHEEKKEEQKRILVQALNELPHRHREAIFLKYFHGMGYQEIQQIMSVNYQTARNYVYHGVKMLKKEFEDRSYISLQRIAM